MEDLLFLSHRIPYPPDKGDKIRAWHFLRHLATRYRVHLAFLIDDPADVAFVPRLQEICASVAWQRLDPLRAKLRSMPGLLRGSPLTRGYFHDRRLARTIDGIVAHYRPTRFFVFSSAMAPYVEHHRSRRRVIDMVDVDSEKWRHYAEMRRGLSRFVYAREAETLLAMERRAAASADSVVFVSRAEAELFRRLAPEVADRVHAVGNGVDAAHFDPDRSYPDPYAGRRTIAFVGAMNYWPNVDAVVWFATEVMPILRARSLRTEFCIVGSHPSRAVRRLAGPDIGIAGKVDDVRPYLAHAALVVAPLRVARGIQNKVLEAMAMARPVVATQQALGGLDTCTADEVVTARTPTEFADAIERLLGAGSAIGRRARTRILDDFCWETSIAEIELQIAPDALPDPRPAPAPPYADHPAMFAGSR